MKKPLFHCWMCDCDVREVDARGLCSTCGYQRKRRPQELGTDAIFKATFKGEK